MEVQNMQEDLGFLQFSDQRAMRCIRTTELSDAVTCRPGISKNLVKILNGDVKRRGWIASQYVKAFDVDFFPDGFGDCVCQSKSIQLFGKCVPFAALLPVIIISGVAILALAILVYSEQKQKAADATWKVDPKDLEYGDPPCSWPRQLWYGAASRVQRNQGGCQACSPTQAQRSKSKR
jgi:hypothetical protein